LQEIQHAYHTNGLLIKLLISQAEKNGIKVAIDTNSLENEVLLRQVRSGETYGSRLSFDQTIFVCN